jgi:hypothetical protein
MTSPQTVVKEEALVLGDYADTLSISESKKSPRRRRR